MPNVPPQDMAGAAQTRLIVAAVRESVAELKSDVKEIKDHRVSDIRWLHSTLAAGFLILASMIITAYFKIDEKMNDLSKAGIQVETRLEDLLQRIPPVSTPAPKK